MVELCFRVLSTLGSVDLRKQFFHVVQLSLLDLMSSILSRDLKLKLGYLSPCSLVLFHLGHRIEASATMQMSLL